MIPKTKVFLMMSILGPVAFAQRTVGAKDTQQAPLVLQRVPPNAKVVTGVDPLADETPNQRRRRLAGQASSPPGPEKYKFDEALDVLKTAESEGTTNPRRGLYAPVAAAPGNEVPKNYSPKSDQPLSPTARDAVKLSEQWLQGRNAPTEGRDGRVVFTYGAGLPTLVCAPLRVCIIELQAGERLTSEPQIGDSVRWSITPTSSGVGDRVTPLLVVKPKGSGLDTNLFVATDRRHYYIRLMSKPESYIARLAFEYPEEDGEKWKVFMQNHPPEEGKEESSSELDLKTLYTNYKIKGGDDSMRPVRVADNGVKTYVLMPEAALHRETPVLVVIGPDGKREIVNYRVHGSEYVVDRLFDHGTLILGAGPKAQKAEIMRASSTGMHWFSRDRYRRSRSENAQ